ncbi:MAG: DNA polymerase III subunit gamma/tau [Pyrinomonadaceae bacterium]
MSYQVIARKWRPQTFEEVTGQEPITRTLRNAIEHERLHHAYLFSGARGVGKTTTARLLAKALNCHKSDRPTATPCRTTDADACSSCREVAEGRSIDVLEIDAASNTGVDNVRESVINTVAVRPARDRYRVFIIDEVHMLSGAAFNALLKTLEEPPERVTFIMATTEAHKVPDTILSRCQQFEFRTIATTKIAERLQLIADAEKLAVEADALHEIARAGEGSMRDAQSAFDQVISFSTNNSITTKDVETALGIAGAEMLARTVRAIVNEKPVEVLQVVDDLAMRGHDFRNFCRDLLTYLRDLLVTKVGRLEPDEMGRDGNSGAAEMRAFVDTFSESDLVRFFHSLTETEKTLRESAHPRYQLEIGLVKLVEMRRLVPLSAIAERLRALEEALRNGTAPAGNTGTTTPPVGGAPSSSNTPPRGTATRGQSRGASSVRADEANSASASTFAPNVKEVASPPQSRNEILSSSQTSRGEDSDSNYKNDSLMRTPSADSEDLFASQSPPISPALKLVSNLPALQTGADSSNSPADSFAPSTRQEDRIDGRPLPASLDASTSNVLERIKTMLEARRRPFLAIALEGAHKVCFAGDELQIEYAPEAKHLRDNLAKPESVGVLRDICREIAGRDMGVRISINDGKTETSGGAPLAEKQKAVDEQAELRTIAESHPDVQQMLKTFRAEIVDVRRVDSNEG